MPKREKEMKTNKKTNTFESIGFFIWNYSLIGVQIIYSGLTDSRFVALANGKPPVFKSTFT